MTTKSQIFIILLTAFLIASCAEDMPVSTYTVSTGVFSNSLMIEGFVEPVNSISITTPRVMSGGIVDFLVEEGEYVEEGQVVCIIKSQNFETQYEMMLLSLENAEVGIVKTQADMNMQLALLEAQVRTNDADTRMAQMDSLQLAFRSPNQRRITELELEKAAIEKARFEKKIAALKVIQQHEIRKLQLEIQRFSLNIQQLKEYIDALTLKAPKSGIIIRGTNPRTGTKFKPGDQAFGNFPIATIPQFDQMKVKIVAPEADFKSISINDSVYYTFDAMPGNTGKGKILKKPPVGQPLNQIVMVGDGMYMIQRSNVKIFEVEASIDSVTTIPEPGFTANCRVILKQEKDVISIPQIAVFDDDSIKVVYVQRKKGFEKRQVLTGVSSLRESVIKAGLEDGDIIALSKPKFSLVKELITLPDSLIQQLQTPAAPPPTPENRPPPPPGMMPNQLRITN